MATDQNNRLPYRMKFDVGTIKHLGLQMYSTLPPVIGELVANGWDANATCVDIVIPDSPLDPDKSEVIISDNGIGMSDEDIRNKYVITGRDRREAESSDETPAPLKRKVMGRKGIGKFSSFGIAREIEIESVKDGEVSRLIMNYDVMLEKAETRSIEFPALPSTGNVTKGTRITLRKFAKFNSRRIPIPRLRKGLARRFSVIGGTHDFEVVINGSPISPEERDLKAFLDRDADGNLYIWPYADVTIKEGEDWTVSGWIGALNRTAPNLDGIDRGIALMARGKLVQEPFVFEAVVGQQYALSYIIGELHVEFVDDAEDTIGTNRNALVWDTDANAALRQWGRDEVNRIAREWARKRSEDNLRALEQNTLYQEFKRKAGETGGNARAQRLGDQLVRQTIEQNPTATEDELKSTIQTTLNFLEFDAFVEIAEDLVEADLHDTGAILKLFREWQVIEAMEMARVTEGRITTIEKLQDLIDTDALEVPVLHNFLKEFPWVIDPRWTMVDDEVWFSRLLREKFPEPPELPEGDRRIDFLCVREGTNLVVVEIKRPGYKASTKDMNQIEEQVNFVRDYISKSTDPERRHETATGYLLCGNLVDTFNVRGKRTNLANAGIYVRLYSDLLATAQRVHKEFINRYNELKEAKASSLQGEP
ncbi:MAG: ATP-binding protein [Caldilineaceae bacterium]|nr:ATP-binding protein [Caldilineaceae bacterium]